MEQTTLTVGTEKKQKPSQAYKSVEKNNITPCCLSIKFNSHFKHQQCLIPVIKIIISHFL